MKKLLVLVLLSGFMVSVSAKEVGESKDSRCIYTKCEMDRSDAQSLDKSEPEGKGKRHSGKQINS